MIYILLMGIFVVAFLVGLVGQIIIRKIEPNKPEEKTNLFEILPWMLSVWIWRIRISFLSLFNNRMKIYRKEMKKTLKTFRNEEECENSVFLNTLIEEPKIKNVEKILNSVLQSQEKVRRKESKEKRLFFIRQHFIAFGPAQGMRIIAYPMYYVYYRRYLKGDYVKNDTIERAFRFFGSSDEKEALKSEYDRQFKLLFQKSRWIEHKLNEERKKKLDKQNIDKKKEKVN